MRLILVALLLTLTACAAQSPRPKLVSGSYPPYPAIAFHEKQAGLVRVKFDVNQLGGVENVRIISSQPTGVFDSTVISTLSKWKYEPNKPAKDVEQKFKFQLTNSF